MLDWSALQDNINIEDELTSEINVGSGDKERKRLANGISGRIFLISVGVLL
jgi:hypothetical protein